MNPKQQPRRSLDADGLAIPMAVRVGSSSGATGLVIGRRDRQDANLLTDQIDRLGGECTVMPPGADPIPARCVLFAFRLFAVLANVSLRPRSTQLAGRRKFPNGSRRGTQAPPPKPGGIAIHGPRSIASVRARCRPSRGSSSTSFKPTIRSRSNPYSNVANQTRHRLAVPATRHDLGDTKTRRERGRGIARATRSCGKRTPPGWSG